MENNQKPEEQIPRRAMLSTMVGAELKIHDAAHEIERLGADERLTGAINLLWQAKDMVSDFVDETGAGIANHDEVKEPTFGEHIVRSKFNPSNVGNVNFFKDKTAEILNGVNEIRDYDPRLFEIVVQKFEEAAMYAVKLATAKS
jgi:hypothetical protein